MSNPEIREPLTRETDASDTYLRVPAANDAWNLDTVATEASTRAAIEKLVPEAGVSGPGPRHRDIGGGWRKYL